MLQQPRLCGLSARARSRVTLRIMLVQFAELVFVADNYIIINIEALPGVMG